MLSDYVSAALAYERQRALLASAEAARAVRRARKARRHGTAAPAPADHEVPVGCGQPVRLRDGSSVVIRQVRPSDAALLADGFTRLSQRTRELRFLAPKARLTATEIRYLTDVDHYDHEALGALSRDGNGVGIARYVRSADDPAAAEVALTIADDWQRRGLGGELMARLSDRAKLAGIDRFTALVTADNTGIIRLLGSLSGTLTGRDGSLLEYEVQLASAGEHDYGFGDLIGCERI